MDLTSVFFLDALEPEIHAPHDQDDDNETDTKESGVGKEW